MQITLIQRKIGNTGGLQTLLLKAITREADLQLKLHILKIEVKETDHHLIARIKIRLDLRVKEDLILVGIEDNHKVR